MVTQDAGAADRGANLLLQMCVCCQMGLRQKPAPADGTQMSAAAGSDSGFCSLPGVLLRKGDVPAPFDVVRCGVWSGPARVKPSVYALSELNNKGAAAALIFQIRPGPNQTERLRSLRGLDGGSDRVWRTPTSRSAPGSTRRSSTKG